MTWQNQLNFKQLSWTKPIVYAWFRGEICLYVGISANGLSRPLCRSHHIIGKAIKPRATDKLCWSEMLTIEHARMLEQFLIRNLQPLLNSAGPLVFKQLREFKLAEIEL